MERYMQESRSGVKTWIRRIGELAAVVMAALAPPALPAQEADAELRARIESSISVLAHDSLQGRGTGTESSRKAAAFIAQRLESYGVEPAVEGSFLQPVPIVRRADGDYGLLSGFPDDGEPIDASDGTLLEAYNVIGVVPGVHDERGDEVVVVGAHFDHLGIRPEARNAAGDSIFNGADDDASGVVAVLEAARAIAGGPRPERTVVFFLSTGEELGLLGTEWYLDRPVRPLEATVANLQVEMIGRPDAQAGGPGRLWLTGHERSTMGILFDEAGLPVIADPRPDQNFFFRSDNIAFAMEGIPAHTLSSFGMHPDYHTPDDEVESLNMDHFGEAVSTVVGAVRALANGERPRWLAGGRPDGTQP